MPILREREDIHNLCNGLVWQPSGVLLIMHTLYTYIQYLIQQMCNTNVETVVKTISILEENIELLLK